MKSRSDSKNIQIIEQRPEIYYAPQDEISLVDLWQILFAKKWVIIATTLLFLVAAIVYALSLSRVYKAEVLFLPPSDVDIEALSTTELVSISKEQLHNQFLNAVTSKSVQSSVYEESNLSYFLGQEGGDKDVLFQGFTDSLSLNIGNKAEGGHIVPSSLSLEGANPNIISSYLNSLVSTANKQVVDNSIGLINAKVMSRLDQIPQEIHSTRELAVRQRIDEIARLEELDSIRRQEILDKIAIEREKAERQRLAEIERLKEADLIERNKLEEQIATLRDNSGLKRDAEIVRLVEADQIKRQEIIEKIEALRINAKLKREDRIQELKEAASIAKGLGIRDQAFGVSQTSSQNSVVYTEISTQKPLYMLGEKALMAEVRELKSRISDDAFIPDLRELQEKLKQLDKNEKVEALKARSNVDPFIPEMSQLQDQLKRLERNERIEVLESRTNNDPFIPELIDLQAQLKSLESNRRIEHLKTRVSDDPYIPELSKLEQEKTKLEGVAIDASSVSAVMIDRPAVPPVFPIKPSRTLITVMGAVLGVVAGLFLAFFFHFLSVVRESEKTKFEKPQSSNEENEDLDKKMTVPPRIVAR